MPPREKHPAHLVIVKLIEEAYRKTTETTSNAVIDREVHVAQSHKVVTLCDILKAMDMPHGALTETIEGLKSLTDRYHDPLIDPDIDDTVDLLREKAQRMLTAPKETPESDKLTFGELKVGDVFIYFPRPGDDSGHGEYKGVHWAFMKIEPAMDPKFRVKYTALRLCDASFSNFPDTIAVMKVGITP